MRIDREQMGTFAGALVATGAAAALTRVCPAGCANCAACATAVLPMAALVGGVGLSAVGGRLARNGVARESDRASEYDTSA